MWGWSCCEVAPADCTIWHFNGLLNSDAELRNWSGVGARAEVKEGRGAGVRGRRCRLAGSRGRGGKSLCGMRVEPLAATGGFSAGVVGGEDIRIAGVVELGVVWMGVCW